jgi:hypothetical protein
MRLSPRSDRRYLGSDSDEVVDGVLLWFREDDGDLVDELVDALTYLTETGPIWLLTPKVGVDGHVDAVRYPRCRPNRRIDSDCVILSLCQLERNAIGCT